VAGKWQRGESKYEGKHSPRVQDVKTDYRSVLIVLTAGVLCGCSPLTMLSAVSPSGHYDRIEDLRYGNGERQTVDIYQPRDAVPGAPFVVYFYGGGWNDGSKEEFEFVASSLTRAGLVVAIPDYRLFPHVADRFGADPSRLYLMGHSAGAQIAALIALDQRYLAAAGVPSPQIAGLIGLSGPYDFLPINEGYLLDLFPEETREASQAINFASADAPPTLLIHGGDDDIVEEGNSQRLAARLRSFGVTVSLKRYDGVGHGRVVVALAPPLDFIAATLDDCIAFIQQH
jgi:acetyl esterase/lipase